METSPELFNAAEHEVELRKTSLFGGTIQAQLLEVSEAVIRLKCFKEVEIGQVLKFRLHSRIHKDELSGVGRVARIEVLDGGWKVELAVEKKAADHDTTIRAMRGWYSSDRYKARTSTRRIMLPKPPPGGV